MSCQTRQRYFRFIKNQEELEIFTQEAIEISNLYNARTYISLIPRSFEKLSLESLVELSKRIKNRDYDSNFKIFEKLALQSECAKKDGKLWMFDVDYHIDTKEFQNIIEYLGKFDSIKIIEKLPTLSGVHLIIKPFNIKILEDRICSFDRDYKLPTGEVIGLKLDCNTLLYCREAKSL